MSPLLRRFAQDVLLPLAVTRAVLLVVGYAALQGLQPNPELGDLIGNPWIDMWSRFDAFWFLTIAHFGYGYVSNGQSNLAFAPLYPALMKAGGLVVGRDTPGTYLATGILVSNVALAVALAFLIALARIDHGEDVARRAALYMLVFPTTFFLSAVYADSLFLAAAIGAFYFARVGRWFPAGALAGLATITRVQGLFIVLPLAIEYLAQREWRPRRVGFDVLGLALVPLAFAGWLAYQSIRFGDPMAFVKAQATWVNRFAPPWQGVIDYFSPTRGSAAGNPLDLAAAVGFLPLVVIAWRVVRPSLALYATLFHLAPLGVLQSESRYALLVFPAFIVLARWGRATIVDRLLVAVGMGLAAYLFALFALRYFIA